MASASPALGELMEGCGSTGLVGVRGAVAAMLATQEVSQYGLSPYTVDRHGRQESNIDFLVYSLTIVVHLDVFLLAIVNKK